MRTLERNKRPVWYSLLVKSEIGYDEYGNELSSPISTFGNPVKIMANVSAASGKVQEAQFGLSAQYDRVIVTDDVDIPLTEASRLWVDTMPVINQDGSTDSPHDYVISRIARSITNVSIAISKVNVGAAT